MKILDLCSVSGAKDYESTWALQKELVEARARDEIEDTLILVEHDPVYTMGRSSSETTKSIRVAGLGDVPVVAVERGGKLTFHGPGQLVGYPIFKLTHRDLRRYLRDIEGALMSALREEAELPAKPCPENLSLEPGQLGTGVWIRDRKIASIGIAVKHWVSYHGFALNLSTDLRYFMAVNPCGFSGDVMTSVSVENRASDSPKVKSRIVRNFENISAALKRIESEQLRNEKLSEISTGV